MIEVIHPGLAVTTALAICAAVIIWTVAKKLIRLIALGVIILCVAIEALHYTGIITF